VIYLDPELILKSPWLWDEKTIAWAQALIDERNRLGKTAALDNNKGESK
jgi:hypothetical protein